MYLGDYISTETETFNEVLRSCVSIFLIFTILLIIGHIIINRLKIKQTDDVYFISRNDQCAYQVALLTCTFSVAITLAAIALLPVSIISNEIVLTYPKSYYMQWINTSLIQNLWNTVSLSSNITIFLLMPFAHLFLDSEGFSGMRSNIHNRITEAMCFLFITIFLVLAVLWMLCIPFKENTNIITSLRDLWQFYLPLIYSIVSLIGVVLLCVLSPIGCLYVFLALLTSLQQVYLNKAAIVNDATETAVELDYYERCIQNDRKPIYNSRVKNRAPMKLSAPTHISKQRYVVEIVVFLLLLLVTVALVLLLIGYVVVNIVGIVAGLHALPQSHSQIQLGLYPSSTLGWFGAMVQIILIHWLLLSSVFALYRVYPMNGCLPRYHSTDINKLMKNCTCVLMLCSASPVQSRLLGVTVFDPLGTFGHMSWLDSGVLVLTYNIGFLVLLGLGAFREAVTTSIHKKVVVNSVREVITITSPTVVKILANNIHLKNEMKTA